MTNILKIIAAKVRKVIEPLQGLGVEPGPWQVAGSQPLNKR